MSVDCVIVERQGQTRTFRLIGFEEDVVYFHDDGTPFRSVSEIIENEVGFGYANRVARYWAKTLNWAEPRVDLPKGMPALNPRIKLLATKLQRIIEWRLAQPAPELEAAS